MFDIPSSVIKADRQVDHLLQTVSFSQYLNPINAEEARQRFLHKGEPPPFAYNPLVDADQYLFDLDAIAPTERHPLSKLLQQKIEDLKLLIVALRDRTPKAFDALAERNDWYPQAEDLNIEIPIQLAETSPSVHSAQELIARLKRALRERNLYEWGIVEDSVMSARVLVDGAKKILRVHPDARFRKNDLERLVVHEIDVHAMRSHCGERQPLRCFSTGLSLSLKTEEGLAMLAEEKTRLLSPNSLQRQQDVVRAIHWGRSLGFRDLYTRLRNQCSPSLAWAICQRIKRGLKDAEQPGVYAKDSVYLRGWKSVRDWIAQGGDIDLLYVGKVGIHHPIEDWIAQGWLTPQRAPLFWKDTERLRPSFAGK